MILLRSVLVRSGPGQTGSWSEKRIRNPKISQVLDVQGQRCLALMSGDKTRHSRNISDPLSSTAVEGWWCGAVLPPRETHRSYWLDRELLWKPESSRDKRESITTASWRLAGHGVMWRDDDPEHSSRSTSGRTKDKRTKVLWSRPWPGTWRDLFNLDGNDGKLSSETKTMWALSWNKCL